MTFGGFAGFEVATLDNLTSAESLPAADRWRQPAVPGDG